MEEMIDQPEGLDMPTEPLDMSVASTDVKKRRGIPKVLKIVLIILVVFLLLLGLIVGVAALQIRGVVSEGMLAKTAASAAYASLKNQNLPETDTKLAEAKAHADAARTNYQKLGWYTFIPLASVYYADGMHGLNAAIAGIEAGQVTVKAIEPYADVLGFKGSGTFSGGTAEDRLRLALDTLTKIMPVVDQIGDKLKTVNSELAQIDERRYPQQVRGMQIRSSILEAKKVASGASYAFTQAKPILEVLPYISGNDGKRKKYLVIFQNDKELRPTGGFMTGYATLFIEQGRVTPEKSDDIYELDKVFRKKPAIPAILGKFLVTEKQWNLRDMNISPDFKTSMSTFYSYYTQLPGVPGSIDGIIVVDTHVLEDLVKVLGPVDVPGFGTFSAVTDKRCDCSQIIYALSEIVDRPTPFIRTNRKGIIGPMMQSILSKAYGAPKQLWPELVSNFWSDLQGKHIQFYFFDPKVQVAAEAINAAGKVVDTPSGSDYEMVVDANLGGAKSNLFVDSKVEEDVSLPQNGTLKKTLTLTYKNPFPPSNCNLEAGQLCLNGVLQDWFRLYLPKGATLVEALGFDTGSTKLYEELNHSVVEGTFVLQPKNQIKLKITYTVPYTDMKTYKLLLQKQGGAEDITHVFTVNGNEQQVVLNKDQTVEIPF